MKEYRLEWGDAYRKKIEMLFSLLCSEHKN